MQVDEALLDVRPRASRATSSSSSPARPPASPARPTRCASTGWATRSTRSPRPTRSSTVPPSGPDARARHRTSRPVGTSGRDGPGRALGMLSPHPAGVVEWQTRSTQNALPERACGFKSRPRHHLDGPGPRRRGPGPVRTRPGPRRPPHPGRTTRPPCASSVVSPPSVGRTGGAGPPCPSRRHEEGRSMGQLDRKIALITGGESGIGLASARLFVAEGARVHLLGIDEPKLKAAVEELGQRQGDRLDRGRDGRGGRARRRSKRVMRTTDSSTCCSATPASAERSARSSTTRATCSTGRWRCTSAAPSMCSSTVSRA